MEKKLKRCGQMLSNAKFFNYIWIERFNKVEQASENLVDYFDPAKSDIKGFSQLYWNG